MAFWTWLKSLFVSSRKPADVIPIKPQPPIENVSPVSLVVQPEHLKMALKQVGRREGKDDAWIVSLFKYTSYQTDSSQTPWCAAFICWLMAMNNMKNTKSAAAFGQCKLGIACADDVVGAVMVWQHLTGSLKGHYHVNMLINKVDAKTWLCVGGNQHDSVSIASYGSPDYRLVSSRKPWPI